jgi:hypothetical protein
MARGEPVEGHGWARAATWGSPHPRLVAVRGRRDARFAGLGRDLGPGPGTRQGQALAWGASATVGSWKGTSGHAVGGGSQGVRRRTKIGGGGAGRLRQTTVRAPWPPANREQRGGEGGEGEDSPENRCAQGCLLLCNLDLEREARSYATVGWVYIYKKCGWRLPNSPRITSKSDARANGQQFEKRRN